jgi:hypothetical protein
MLDQSNEWPGQQMPESILIPMKCTCRWFRRCSLCRAAPELLQTCQATLEVLDSWRRGGDSPRFAQALRVVVENAVSKARGR